jgi:hypothetical protein
MRRLIGGIAVLPLLTGLALAGQPVQLSDSQMDKISAGLVLHEFDLTNTSTTEVGIRPWYESPFFSSSPVSPVSELTPCNQCYLGLDVGSLVIQSAMGPFGP